MAVISLPAGAVPPLGSINGRAPLPFSGAAGLVRAWGSRQDFRQLIPTTGTISERVMVKLAPSSPESPFANGRVWLLRLADGYKAWDGWSDAQGYYTATGLEVGVEYIAVGIDPTRNHKATGAGPVAAKESP